MSFGRKGLASGVEHMNSRTPPPRVLGRVKPLNSDAIAMKMIALMSSIRTGDWRAMYIRKAEK